MNAVFGGIVSSYRILCPLLCMETLYSVEKGAILARRAAESGRGISNRMSGLKAMPGVLKECHAITLWLRVRKKF